MANKTRKLITLSQEMDAKLDGINASALIEELLEGHFNYLNSNNIKVLQKKRAEQLIIVKNEQAKLDILENRIDEIAKQSKLVRATEEEKDHKKKDYMRLKIELRKRGEAGELTREEFEALQEQLKSDYKEYL